MAKVVALFESKDKISPELVRMRRETDKTNRSFGGMHQKFQHETQRMERQVHSLRSEIKRLESVKVKPKVELDDKASQGISNLKQQLIGLGGLAAGTIGGGAGGVMTDLQAAFRERALYAAKGKTQEEIKAFDKRSKELININPNLNLKESMAIQSRSEQLNGKKGGAYAEEAAKLGVTTKYTSDEHLKMLSVMSKSMEVDDPKRLANAIQYMSNNLVDFKDEFVDSVVEYTVQTSKFLDTPEKLATLVGEIGKLGVWSDDKALVALKESSLKFTNQDDVTRPSTAVYSYRQNYRGTVTNPGSDTRTYTYYYRYAVTIEYADNFNPTLPLFTNRQPNAYGKCNVEHSENRIRHRQGKRSYSKVPS